MNQILKDSVYGMGTTKQVNFIADIGGMNEEERQIFLLLHEKKNDEYIQDAVGMSRKSYERVLESVRAKTLLAVFECINHYMD